MPMPELIACLGLEGGGLDIYGEPGPPWIFWSQGTSMDFDEQDNEVWRSWESERTENLESLLPQNWPMFYPSELHPQFKAWFKQQLQKAILENRVFEHSLTSWRVKTGISAD